METTWPAKKACGLCLDNIRENKSYRTLTSPSYLQKYTKGMEVIEKMDAAKFTDYLKKYQNTICGRFPIGVLLNAMNTIQRNGNGFKMSFKFVKYEQSSKCKTMRDSSVSYASGALVIQDSNHH